MLEVGAAQTVKSLLPNILYQEQWLNCLLRQSINPGDSQGEMNLSANCHSLITSLFQDCKVNSTERRNE